MIHVVGGPVKGPDELFVRKGTEGRSWESSTGDNFVSHHLETVEDGDGVGGELHPPVLLIPHVRGCGTFLPQDPELSQWEPVHQTAARHVWLSDEEVGHYRVIARVVSCPGWTSTTTPLRRGQEGDPRTESPANLLEWTIPRYHHQDKQSDGDRGNLPINWRELCLIMRFVQNFTSSIYTSSPPPDTENKNTHHLKSILYLKQNKKINRISPFHPVPSFCLYWITRSRIQLSDDNFFPVLAFLLFLQNNMELRSSVNCKWYIWYLVDGLEQNYLVL